MLGDIFGILVHFLVVLAPLGFCTRFFPILVRFFTVWEGVLGGSGLDFLTIFCNILENDDFVKSVVLLWENHSF